MLFKGCFFTAPLKLLYVIDLCSDWLSCFVPHSRNSPDLATRLSDGFDLAMSYAQAVLWGILSSGWVASDLRVPSFGSLDLNNLLCLSLWFSWWTPEAVYHCRHLLYHCLHLLFLACAMDVYWVCSIKAMKRTSICVLLVYSDCVCL